MKRLGGIFVLGCALLVGCKGAAGSEAPTGSAPAGSSDSKNLLIGSWKLSAGGDASGCAATMVYTKEGQVNAAGNVTPIIYSVQPTMIFTVGSTGIEVKWDIIDHDHIVHRSGYGACPYDRQ